MTLSAVHPVTPGHPALVILSGALGRPAVLTTVTWRWYYYIGINTLHVRGVGSRSMTRLDTVTFAHWESWPRHQIRVGCDSQRGPCALSRGGSSLARYFRSLSTIESGADVDPNSFLPGLPSPSCQRGTSMCSANNMPHIPIVLPSVSYRETRAVSNGVKAWLYVRPRSSAAGLG